MARIYTAVVICLDLLALGWSRSSLWGSARSFCLTVTKLVSPPPAEALLHPVGILTNSTFIARLGQ
jgi:hypothetical protein